MDSARVSGLCKISIRKPPSGKSPSLTAVLATEDLRKLPSVVWPGIRFIAVWGFASRGLGGVGLGFCEALGFELLRGIGFPICVSI